MTGRDYRACRTCGRFFHLDPATARSDRKFDARPNRQRSPSSWTVVVDLGSDPVTGRRRQLSRAVRGPKREAEALLVQLLHERDTGVERPAGKITVAAYLEQWSRDYVEPSLAPKTASTYRDVVRAHLVPALGSLDPSPCGRRTFRRCTRGCSSAVAPTAGAACGANRGALSPNPARKPASGGPVAVARA
jgi:hypothetical protein